MMNHIGLFEGEGGFSLVSHWMGWRTIAWCEWNKFGQYILEHHFPNANKHGDITKTDFTIYRGRVDILTGGFPCQPYSVAGKQKGTEDERHLWPEMLRAIREASPRWVVGENVGGLVSWNGGLVFEQVQADLEAEGYEVLPFLLPAAGVNAPHRRDRIWFIAYAHDKGRSSGLGEVSQENGEVPERNEDAEPCDTNSRFIAYSENYGSKSESWRFKNWKKRRILSSEFSKGSESIGNSSSPSNTNGRRQPCKEYRKEESGQFAKESIPTDWRNFPTQSPVCSGDDGLPTELVRQRIREDSMGYLSEKEIDKILSEAYNQWRNESIKAGGNAIVPQVALQIFKAIEQYEILIQNGKF